MYLNPKIKYLRPLSIVFMCALQLSSSTPSSKRETSPTVPSIGAVTNFIICKDNQFICSQNGQNICVPLHWKCDATQDCDEGSDEANCGQQESNLPIIFEASSSPNPNWMSSSPNPNWMSSLPNPNWMSSSPNPNWESTKTGLTLPVSDEVNSTLMPYNSTNEGKFTYTDALARCYSYNSEPFIPKSKADWDLIIKTSLSHKSEPRAKMWIPASDGKTEKNLVWNDGTDGNSDVLIRWMNRQTLHGNSPQHDCLVSDATHFGHVTMDNCNEEANPMMCVQKDSSTSSTPRPLVCDSELNLVLPEFGNNGFDYNKALNRCKQIDARPFKPRTQADWECIQSVNNNLSDRTRKDTFMWIPADDRLNETVLLWYDQSNINDDTLIPWINNNTLENNNKNNDCLMAYSYHESRVQMGKCVVPMYPMICIKDESTTSVTSEETTITTTPLIETTVSDSLTTESNISTSGSTSTTTKKPECESCSSKIPFPELYPDYTWPEGVRDTISTYNCPDGLGDKNGTWTCQIDCTWKELPDLSQCGTVDIDVWTDELMNGSQSAGDTLNYLSTDLTTLDKMAPGDVISVLEILSVSKERHQIDLANLSTQEEQLALSFNYTESTLHVTDAILGDPQVWSGLPKHHRYKEASNLQVTVEEAAIGTASLLQENSMKNFSTPTTDVHVEKFSRNKYRQNDVFTHPKFNSTYIKLPNMLDEHSLSANILTFMAFSNLHQILGTSSYGLENITFPYIDIVASPVIGLTLGNSSWHSDNDGSNNFVQATFLQLYPLQEYNVSDLRCVSWSIESNNWDTSGCWLVEGVTPNTTTCHCNHLTNLAVIMDVNGVLDSNSKLYVLLEYVTLIGCSMSIVCLAATIICLTIFTDIRSKMITKIHINVCFSLMTAEIIMLAGLDQTGDATGCIIIAAFLHYFFLATFMWSAIEGFYLYLKIIRVFPTVEPKLRTYLLVGYTIPLLFVVITLASTLPVKNGISYIGEYACWLGPGIIWAFAAPLGLIMIINVVIFVLCMRAQWRTNPSEVQQQKSNVLVKLRGSASIFIVLGITWITGFLYIDNPKLAIYFTILNSLQGVIIFLLLIPSDRILRTRFRMMFSRWNGKEYHQPNNGNQGRRTTESELISKHQSSSIHDEHI